MLKKFPEKASATFHGILCTQENVFPNTVLKTPCVEAGWFELFSPSYFLLGNRNAKLMYRFNRKMEDAMFFGKQTALFVAVCVAIGLGLQSNPTNASELPAHIETCIKDRAPQLLFPRNRREAWQKFRAFTHRDYLGRLAYRRDWVNGSEEFKHYGHVEFFSYLWQNRRQGGSRKIVEIKVEPRSLPDHAFRRLIHVHVAITYGDGDVKRANLLGTEDCKLVDVAWGDVWLSWQLHGTAGLIERKIIQNQQAESD